MRTICLMGLILLLSLTSLSFLKGEEKVDEKGMQPTIDTIVSLFKDRKIKRVEIYSIPFEVLTSITMTPMMLEKQFYTKITVRDIRMEIYRDFITSFETIKVHSHARSADLRMGIVFYDIYEKRVGAIYFDKFSNGFVDNVPVYFQGKFMAFVTKNFSCVLK